MPNAPHAITRLTFENYRNYRQFSVEVPPQPVVITGHNGAGKTNILEAISLLSPGRGMRGAKLRGIDHAGGNAPWVVAAEITTRGEVNHIGTGRDAESGMEKRILKINGQRERGQASLTKYISVQWLTPSLDQVFIEGGTARRKLLDRITYGFDPEHAARVTAYEGATRERNRLLNDGRAADPYWLSVLEQQMAEHAVSMTLARLDAIQRIRQTFAEVPAAFARADIQLFGAIEGWLQEGMSALDAEAKFAGRLTDLRAIDAVRGRASEGPHRSSLDITHTEKQMKIEDCSTGEQKAVLLAMVIAAALARAHWCGLPPILLLDEVISHLDAEKRTALFDLMRHVGIQAWMTGTDAEAFRELSGYATHLTVSGGRLEGLEVGPGFIV